MSDAPTAAAPKPRRYHPERLNELDTDLAVAWLDVLEARDRWSHSPNSETVAAEEAAVKHMDDLLKLRQDMDPHELPAEDLARLGFA